MDHHYQVRYEDRGLGKTYGVCESYSKEAEKAANQGKVIVAHAIYPTRVLVQESSVVDVPLSYGGEYDTYVQIMQDLHEVLADRLGRDRLQHGHLFAMGVADGSAHYVVTKVRQATCTVEWRGFCGDRWVDRVFGWGGSFRRRDVEPLVGIGHKSLSELLDPNNDHILAIEEKLPSKIAKFRQDYRHSPQDMDALFSQVVGTKV
jgi:hypothetical protein